MWLRMKILKSVLTRSNNWLFLFKEEDLNPGQKKKYSIGILDIWTIDQRILIIYVPAPIMLMIFLKIPNLRTVPRF